ncbi:hypothetical protein D3C75_898440 [compost metagenome]
MRAQADAIVHAHYPRQFAHGAFGEFLLILPVHLAFQGYPAFLHDDLDIAFGCIGAPRDNVDGTIGDSVISGTRAFFQANLYFLSHRTYAFDRFDRAFGTDFLSIALDVTGERDNAFVHAHADLGGVDIGLKIKLIQNGIAQG